MLSPAYIRRLEGDTECLDAMTWLAGEAERYPVGKFQPPLTAKTKSSRPKRVIALTFRLGRKSRLGGGARVRRADWYNDGAAGSCSGDSAQVAAGISTRLLTSKLAGSLLVTSGLTRHVLDVLLESCGPSLLSMGYSLQPCFSGGAVSFITIRKGKRSWVLTYFETMTGSTVDIGRALAQGASHVSLHQSSLASALYDASAAYADWLAQEFGAVLHHTVGMTAMECARLTLPADLKIWRPVPLLAAMERAGFGYRGGITYAKRYRGSTWRIDVNRQYTAALAQPLPQEVAFCHYGGAGGSEHGVYVCRVSTDHDISYPLGVWVGPERGFAYTTRIRGTVVCVLHTAEFPALRALGATIEPDHGYAYTRVFSFADYVQRLQTIMDTHGRDSPQAALSKPLGNYLYGKLAQRPERLELLFTDDEPDDTWFPYWDQDGKAWEQVWKRKTVKHSASQHVDIAGTITAGARAQTAQTWAYLQSLGLIVVRCHTDSLTVTEDPSPYLLTDENAIGSWRLEQRDYTSVIVGPNAVFDDDGAHIAGISEPTYDMIDRLYDGQVVSVAQTENAPRRGWQRETRVVPRELRATAT